MSNATILTMVPATREVPRGAILVGLISNFALDVLSWNKARVAKRKAANDAMELRAYANSIRNSEPSLAADLLAAADRAV